MSKLADKNITTNPLDINIFYFKIEVTSGVDIQLSVFNVNKWWRNKSNKKTRQINWLKLDGEEID